MKKILLIGSQHGDEVLGDKLIRRIKLYHSDLLKYVDFCIANPKAHRIRKRYVESDMNRSFIRGGLSTYESRRADKLLTKIKAGNFSLALDLHTTTDKMEPCFIVAGEKSKNVTNFLKASHITKVVVMEHEIVAKSLIGNVENALSVEVSIHSVRPDFLEQLIMSIKLYVQAEIPESAEKEVYYVDSLIEKAKFSPSQFRKMKNFERFEDSFYPILIRSNSYKKYKKYRGFGATVKLTKAI